MVPAAVGFQCPDCVQQGAKQTRSAQTPYGGKRSANPGLTSMALIAINAMVWLLIQTTGGRGSEWIPRLALMGQGKCVKAADAGTYYPNAGSDQLCSTIPGAHWAPGVADGAWWQLATSMFSHVDLMHIAFNLLALWFLGPQLEQLMGRTRFLAIYLVSGLTGSAVVYLLSDPGGQTLGASGSIFGLMGALLVVGLKSGGNVSQLLVWIGLNVFITISGANISWQGHLGGFLGGVILAGALAYVPRKRRVLWQILGVSLVLVAVLASVATRTAALI